MGIDADYIVMVKDMRDDKNDPKAHGTLRKINDDVANLGERDDLLKHHVEFFHGLLARAIDAKTEETWQMKCAADNARAYPGDGSLEAWAREVQARCQQEGLDGMITLIYQSETGFGRIAKIVSSSYSPARNPVTIYELPENALYQYE